MLIAFLMPITKRYLPGFIALYGLFAIFCAVRTRRLYFEKSNWIFLFPIVIYSMMILGVNSSAFEFGAWKELEFKLSMVAFPFLILITPRLSKSEVTRIFDVFVFGCVVFVLGALAYGGYRAFHFNSREYLTYNGLGVYFHPTYMAIYQSISLMILLFNGVKMNFYFRNKWAHWSMGVLIILFIAMLASKAGLASAVLVLIWFAIVSVMKGGVRQRPILIAAVGISLLVLFSFGLPLTAQRIEGAAADVQQIEVAQSSPEAHSSTALRIVTWSASWELMKQKMGGAGVGNTSSELNKIYKLKGQNYAAEKNLNAHNQFLQVGAEHGWIGFGIFSLFIMLLVVQSIRTRSALYIGFLGIMIFNFLFESCLEVQAGVVFFYFFLLIFSKMKSEDSKFAWF